MGDWIINQMVPWYEIPTPRHKFPRESGHDLLLLKLLLMLLLLLLLAFCPSESRIWVRRKTHPCAGW